MAFGSDLFKLEGIILDDGTLRAGHEPLEAGGEEALAGGGQHAQQLLKGQEGGGQLELHLHAGKVAYVRDPGGEVVRVEPGPGHAAVVVVVQVPLDGPSVGCVHMNHVYISIVPLPQCCGSALFQCGSGFSFIPQYGSESREQSQRVTMRIRIVVRLWRRKKLKCNMKTIIYEVIGHESRLEMLKFILFVNFLSILCTWIRIHHFK
jgi:hypothetical protein